MPLMAYPLTMWPSHGEIPPVLATRGLRSLTLRRACSAPFSDPGNGILGSEEAFALAFGFDVNLRSR